MRTSVIEAESPKDVSPLVAHNGPWVHQYEASSWVHSLSQLAPDQPQRFSSDALLDYTTSALPLPLVLASMAFLVALLVPSVLQCCLPKIRSPSAGPPWRLNIAAGLATICFWAIALISSHQTVSNSLTVAFSVLDHSAETVERATSLAQAFRASGEAVVADLQRLQTDCPASVQDYVSGSVAKIVGEVQGYLADIEQLTMALKQMPEQIDWFTENAQELGELVSGLITVPASLVFLCFVALCGTLVLSEFSGRRCARRCAGCEMPLVSWVCVMPAILAVGAAAACQLLIAISVAGLCPSADETVLDQAKVFLGSNSTEFSTIKYYVIGSGPNPLMEDLADAQVEIVEAMDWVQNYGAALTQTCPAWGKEGVAVLNLQTIQYSMNETERLLAPGHIYPYYDETIHETFCRSIPEDMALVALLQALLGLVCLPLLACTASCVHDSLIDERAMVHGVPRFDLLAQESDGEGPLD